MIKGVYEILDMLLKGYGNGIIENYMRAMGQNPLSLSRSSILDKLKAIIGLLVYSIFHSFILCLEMFTLHVVLNGNLESIISFIFINNFAEVKITVFKKCTPSALYQYISNDAVERYQMIIYLTNIMMTTSQDKL